MADDTTKLTINIETVLKGLAKTVQGLDTVEKKLRSVAGIRLPTGKATSAATFDKTAIAAQKLLQQQQKLVIQSQELANRQERTRQATDKLRIAAERLARAQERATKASQPKLGRSADEHVREFRAREREARRAQREIDRIIAQTKRQAERNARDQERVETRLANHKIKEAERAARAQARALERNIAAQRSAASGEGGSGLLGAATLGGVIGGATVAAIATLTNSVRSGAQAWLEYASKLENARIAFSTMLGGAADAEAHLNRLKQFALETPFAFDELVDASQRMQALGFRAEEVIPVLRDVGNAVAAAGGGSERLERVIKALSDVRARGTLQSQEIRQFAEAGISAFQILREETGKTTVELQDMVEKGQISADFFLKAFQKFSQLHFGDLMEQQSKTFLGALTNIGDVLLQLASKAFEPLFSKISEIAVRVQAELKKTSDLDEVADILANGFFELGGFLAEKIGEGIAARMVSPAFWKRISTQSIRASATAIRSFGAELQNTIAEAATGRRRGEVTAFDLRNAQIADTLKRAVAGVGNAVKSANAEIEQLAKSQQAASEINKKASEIYTELRESISDVSSVSSELATRQALLRAGVTDLTTGYAAMALAMAAAADAQKTLNEQQEAADKRVRERNQGLREQLEAVRDSTRLAAAELAAEPSGGLPELDRFNRTIGAQVDGVLEAARSTGIWNDELEGLSLALQQTRKDLGDLDVQIANKKAKDEADKLIKARLEVTRSLFDLQRGLNQAIQGTDLTELEQTAERVRDLFGLKVPPDAFDPLIELFQAAETYPTLAIEQVQQILSTVRGDLGPEFDKISQSIVNAFQAAAKLDKQLKDTAERSAQLSRLFLGLRIEEERVQDRILDGAISEREGRAEILALQQKYREEILKILQIELILAKARKDSTAALNIQAQIEDIQRLGKAIDVEGQRINQELFGNIEQGFEGIFNSALDGLDSVLDAVENLGRSILATFNRIAAQSLTEQLFGGLLKPDSENTKGTPGGFLSKLFGTAPKAADTGAGAALTTAATAAGTALTAGGTGAATALTTGGVSAGAALTTGGATASATLLASITSSAAAFSAAVIAAGAAFAAAVAASSAAQGASSLLGGAAAGLGAATGLFPAVPGGLLRFVEGGYPEAVLTTDPKHAARQAQILKQYLAKTKGLFGRFKIPEFAEGGWSSHDAEMNMLNSIAASRNPTQLTTVPDSLLAGAGEQRPFGVRVINQVTSRSAARPYVTSEEGVRDIINIISENAPEIGRRLGVR